MVCTDWQRLCCPSVFCLIHTRTYGQLIELQVCMMGKVERHFPPLYEVLGTGRGGGPRSAPELSSRTFFSQAIETWSGPVLVGFLSS